MVGRMSRRIGDFLTLHACMMPIYVLGLLGPLFTPNGSLEEFKAMAMGYGLGFILSGFVLIPKWRKGDESDYTD